MTRILSWIVMIPLAAAVIVFTISNRGPVEIDLWPASYRFEVPVVAAVLAAAIAGFLCGAIVSFLSAGRRRARNRQLMRMLENSKREEAILREQIKKLQSAAAKPAPASSHVPLLTKADAS